MHDKHPLPDLLHGNEQRVYGDSAYARQKALIAGKASRARDFTKQRTRRVGEVDEVQRAFAIASRRPLVELLLYNSSRGSSSDFNPQSLPALRRPRKPAAAACLLHKLPALR